MTVMATVAGSNGPKVLRAAKDKESGFGTPKELEQYIEALVTS